MSDHSRIVLIDGYGQIYRHFHAIPVLTNARGEPVNALFGMARFLLGLDEALPNATHGALVLDAGRPARRLELLPEYKANRPHMPDELRRQLPLISEWAAAAGWPQLREEGREADDLIAAVALNCPGQQVAVISFDKDLAQLVKPGAVEVLQPGPKGRLEPFGPAEIEAKFGVPPGAIGDFLALVGDTSDNIDGVPGVGPKTAAALLRQFGTLDALLANPDAVEKPALRETLRHQAGLLRRNRALVALDTRLPDGWTGWEGLRRRPADFARLTAMAQEHGFRSLEGAIAKAHDRYRNQDLFSFMG